MNAHQNFKSELRPLPMRITQLQFERLHGARARDGLSVQEHVRRALDVYLGKIERDFAKASSPPEAEAELPGVVSADQRPPDGASLASVLPAMPMPARKTRSRPVVRSR